MSRGLSASLYALHCGLLEKITISPPFCTKPLAKAREEETPCKILGTWAAAAAPGNQGWWRRHQTDSKTSEAQR